MRTYLVCLLGLMFLSLSMFGLPVAAVTPDGQTPAEEMVCVDEVGALKGLCNAYCEAMDCNLDEGVHASPKACERVLANYHSKSGDIDPPCLDSGCAATATADANAVYAACTTKTTCGSKHCVFRARSKFNRVYSVCVNDCRTACADSVTSCRGEAKADYADCLELAGDDNDAARLVCIHTVKAAQSACGTAHTQCTTSCSDLGTEKYVPESDVCDNP